MPTNSPALMSSGNALTRPVSFQPSFSATAVVAPSRVFTVSIDPSTLTIVPRTPILSAARVGGMLVRSGSITAPNAPVVVTIDISFIVFSLPERARQDDRPDCRDGFARSRYRGDLNDSDVFRRRALRGPGGASPRHRNRSCSV